MFGSPLVLAVDVSDTHLNCVWAKKRRGRIQIVDLQRIERPQQKEMVKFPKADLTVTALPSSQVLARTLKLPLKRPNDIQAALPFQGESLFPFPSSKSSMTYQMLQSSKSSSHICLFAAKQEHIDRHLATLATLGIHPDQLPIGSVALASLMQWLTKANESRLILHLGEKEGIALIEKAGKVLSQRAFDIEAFEIQKTVAALLSSLKEPISTLYLFAPHTPLASRLEELTGKKVIRPTLDALPSSFDVDQIEHFWHAIATAIASLNSTPNLLPPPAAATTFKRRKKTLFATCIFATALISSLYFFHLDTLANQQKQLIAQSEPLFEAFKIQNSITNSDQLNQAINDLEIRLQKRGSPFPLTPVSPLITDFLAWSSSAPFCDGSITLQQLKYKMVSHPTLEKKDERYLAKIEVTLHATDGCRAQTLFIEQNPFLDNSKTVEWKRVEGATYKASFYLKDKTRYS